MARLDLAKEMEQDLYARARSYKTTSVIGQHPPGSTGKYPMFRWCEIRCAELSCMPSDNARMGLTASCDHIKLIRDLGLDAEYMNDSSNRNNQPYNAVLASLRLRNESNSVQVRNRGYINFGIAFGDLQAIWNSKEPLWGQLWLVLPTGGSPSYRFSEKLESDVVLGRPENMTTNNVRTLGLQYLVEKYFSGIKCEDPNHGLRGETLLDQPRKVSSNHWRNIRVLDEVARIIADGSCLSCQNSAGSFGLADL